VATQNPLSQFGFKVFHSVVGWMTCQLAVVRPPAPPLPTLELQFRNATSPPWKTDAKDFAMPVKVGRRANWQVIQPTTEWKTLKTELRKRF